MEIRQQSRKLERGWFRWWVGALGVLLLMALAGCEGGGATKPGVPAGLTASAGDGRITLAWNASMGATKYNIYRGTTANGEGTTAATTTTTPNFTDTNLTNGTAYYYKVTAVNSAGESNRSAEVSATPAAASTTPSPNPVYGLNFSPYVKSGQDPNLGSVISNDQITALLTTVKPYTQWIRTFGTQNGLENIAPLARQQGFKTAIGAYIGSDATVNNAQIANLVSAAKAGNVDLAIVGNEVLLNNTQTEAQMLAYIQQVKSQIPNVKVTYADTWNTMVAHPNVINAVDVVAVNIYPFYENVTIDQALSQLQSDYAKTVQAVGGKQVIITETGWASSGAPPSFSPASIPSLNNATAYFVAVEKWARSANISLFYFEAYDESWKASHKDDYPSFGIWDANGNLKPGMQAGF